MNTKRLRQFISPLLLLLVGMTGLAGCSGDGLPGEETDRGDTAAQSLTVTVSDAGGYALGDGAVQTRTTDKGYATTFVGGDQIGVFAVKDGQIVTEVNNLCLTAMSWNDKNNTPPRHILGATYYAYYPYNNNLDPKLLNPSATTAKAFFANYIKNWTPDTDQSSHEKYCAQDLMIAQGTVDGSAGTLAFSMEHQMALVLIDLPKTRFTAGSGGYTWLADAPNNQFKGFSPYRQDGDYRYLVNPAVAGVELSGGYTNAASASVEWSFTPSGLTAGKYKTYQVDKGSSTIIAKSYTLQVGDFFLNDGALIPKDATLSEAQKKACVGIVFNTTEGKGGSQQYTHGRIVSLNNWWSNYTNAADIGRITAEYPLPSPDICSEWYLPPMNEILPGGDPFHTINAALEKLGKPLIRNGDGDLYWTSTKYDNFTLISCKGYYGADGPKDQNREAAYVLYVSAF